MAILSTSRSNQTFLSILQILLISLLAHLATAAPINTTDEKLLSISTGANGLSLSLGAPAPSCATGRAEWFQPSGKFDEGDCKSALNLFYNDYVKDHTGTRYEFLSSGVSPVHGIPTQRVPLRIGYGTCIIAVVMRNEFKMGELPAETPFKSAGSDISSFSQIYQAAQDIDDKCSAPLSEPGWQPAGDLNSIGVFIWQSASDINKRIAATTGTNAKIAKTATNATTAETATNSTNATITSNSTGVVVSEKDFGWLFNGGS